ncbi:MULTISPECIES: nucleotidyl transferase AbiEii/AbiGii toxin family protein [unclassified Pseudomonas]|uniref:nucleotidyl transferase AbiEii/AbiGii toxin family protein n=1 Tax=unclassified Pseudomonas TaxID=196821 RepID=UPI0019126CAA|nr:MULTISPECIES: nucleotidyl transferase AbiEii/AbiGii toxin family protein [unclassified Pseudomonas]MBK5549080.1 nucleotidyl transferase AbiEii/AbiGii toxin family protein [Pseudomonas sp. TH03]MEB0223056.1 nucleotidyl transferase AbiEii/AbiGii toxin family protein [Pseudomonas sp. 5S1]MEB0297591.1 nucleotidyl transferase AbiEii/AbiGii toxin family protein [Pseudomonas sp. 10S4]WPX20652.1 nucleotidyl transferase AbiEii/AbiGii toxin family protein [Pseudomonas sp. 10S4]
MSLFDELVDEALKNQQALAPLRVVVEKELLHHDIMLALSSAGMLAKLTFIGGTCLRACYGSNRLSEDLDFTGGADFNRESLTELAHVLVTTLKIKYGLEVEVGEPVREEGNVDTWKLRVQTRPGRRDLPAQRINIDVCSIPSYQPQPMQLLNPYGVDMGTSGLILQAETREEIYADKIVAFALRPNRIKNRDLWDMVWLRQQGITPQLDLIAKKLDDHHCEQNEFLALFKDRSTQLDVNPKVVIEFRKEMSRFLPAELVAQTVNEPAFWTFLVGHIRDLYVITEKALRGDKGIQGFEFKM